MSWHGGGPIFGAVAEALQEHVPDPAARTAVASVLLRELYRQDWSDDQPGLYRDDPAIIEAFRENGAYLWWEEGEED